jgi:D-serine deaminase-like pyridoxal phosphate-dependent protein
MNFRNLPTPALLVDLDALESNLSRMAAFFRSKPAKLRPHFKNHKVLPLVRKQLEAGAIGMTCATVREAAILVEHNVPSILLANEIMERDKLACLAQWSRRVDIMLAVDSEAGITAAASVAREQGVAPNVVVDVNIGMNRCGVSPGASTVRLVKAAVAAGLRFRGLMGYDGHLQAQAPSPKRDELVRRGSQSLIDSKVLIEKEGIPVEIVSTGGTGTYNVSGDYPGITEIQAGSYLLMDTLYVNRDSPFQPSLSILTTVISKPARDRFVIDCGVKALSSERGLSTVKGIDGLELKALHAEHGLVEAHASQNGLDPGDNIELWVNYSDATVNLHSRMYGVSDGEVKTVFTIEH